MKGYKIKCPKCGKSIEVSFAPTKSLWEPTYDIDNPITYTAKTIQCPHCYNLYASFIPKTIEEFCSPQPPTCFHCGKHLTTEDDLLVVHTLTAEKPATYEYAGYKDNEPVYRKVKDKQPETKHRYIFCSIDCYHEYLRKYGFKFEGAFQYTEY